MAVNRPPSAADIHHSGRPARPGLVGRLVACGLIAVLAAGCASPWHASRTKASSSRNSQIKDVKEFIRMPRVGLPFDEEK